MAAIVKQDSNNTGLRYSEEAFIGVLKDNPVWKPLEPNAYSDFGGEIKTVARRPINSSRQQKKGVVVDVDSAGGFNQDFVNYLDDLMQGFCFADAHRKGEGYFPTVFSQVFTTTFAVDTATITAHGLDTGAGPYQVSSTVTLPSGLTAATNYWIIRVDANTFQFATTYALAIAGTEVALADDGTGVHTMVNSPSVLGGASDDYIVNNPAGFVSGYLLFAKGFSDPANNGFKVCNGVSANAVSVSTDLANESNAPYGARVVVVGVQSATGDLDVDASGILPTLTSTTLNFTTLGLTVGEWIYIGGDSATNQFTTTANNGFARIYSIAANVLTFDQTQFTMATEANTTKDVHLFFGRFLRNEPDVTNIIRRTYQIERTLGAADDATPSAIQSELLVGATPNEVTFNFDTADKIHLDMSFVCQDTEQRTSTTGIKAGLRPDVEAYDAFNTTSNFSMLKMAVLDRSIGANPSALFAFLSQFNITINNNVSPNKAISVLGAFEMTAGQFMISGDVTAYFSSIEAVQAVRNNSDVTIHFALAKNNIGFVLDIPLVTLSDGRANVELDNPIMLDLSSEAAEDEVLHTTVGMVFFDYLPTAAE